MQKKNLVKILKNGGVGILPTDTIYGIVGSALDRETVERIYVLRKRNPDKPLIILIASINDLRRFGVGASHYTRAILGRLWPGKVSVILPCRSEKFSYLHRGTKQLAFRLPDTRRLRALLEKTGPLVAPSANIEGEPAANTVNEAKKYFGETVDFYDDNGRLVSPPSTLVLLKGKKIVVLREGAADIKKLMAK